jgi:uncharacterized protein YkwD
VVSVLLGALALLASTALVSCGSDQTGTLSAESSLPDTTLPAGPDVAPAQVVVPSTVPAPEPVPEPEPAPEPKPGPAPSRAGQRTAAPAAAPTPVEVPPPPPPPPPPVEPVGGQPGLGEVNAFREGNGVPGLAWDGGLAATAAEWSSHMANAGGISHRGNLFAGTSGCSRVSENVAYAGSLSSALSNLEQSPTHRENLLDGGVSRVGIGVVESGGRVYVTQIFCG